MEARRAWNEIPQYLIDKFIENFFDSPGVRSSSLRRAKSGAEHQCPIQTLSSQLLLQLSFAKMPIPFVLREVKWKMRYHRVAD